MAKFKVGDKVRVTYGWAFGSVGIIKNYDETMKDHFRVWMKTEPNHSSIPLDGGFVFYSCESLCELVVEQPRREFIVIRRSGAETIAELRHDRDVIRSARATCAPSDTFDLDTGAKLAFDRLMGREEPKPAPKPDPYAKYFTHSKDFESRSKFKIGDLVIRDGETKTVVGHERDSSNWVWTLDDRDSRPYPNLEHFLSPAPAPEPTKFYTGKVFAEKSDDAIFASRDGRVFEFVDGKCINSVQKDLMDFGAIFPTIDRIRKEYSSTTWHEVKSDV